MSLREHRQTRSKGDQNAAHPSAIDAPLVGARLLDHPRRAKAFHQLACRALGEPGELLDVGHPEHEIRSGLSHHGAQVLEIRLRYPVSKPARILGRQVPDDLFHPHRTHACNAQRPLRSLPQQAEEFRRSPWYKA